MRFVKIGNRIINLAMVTDVKLDAKVWTYEDGNVPGVFVFLSSPEVNGDSQTTGRVLEFTGDEAQRVQEVFLTLAD